jgi:hypothetical protein
LRKAAKVSVRAARAEEVAGYKTVKVFYATDRRVTVEGDYIGEYGSRKELHYGSIQVGVPSRHDPGKTEAPSDSLDADPLSHIIVLSMDTTLRANRTAFLTDLNGTLPGGKNELLIFIHGYNCTLKGAAIRAAQLKADLSFKGQVMAYSWASKGDLSGYGHDEKTVQMTVGHLEELLKTLMKEVSLLCLNRFMIAGYTAVSLARRFVHPQDLVCYQTASNLHLRQTKLGSTFSWLSSWLSLTLFLSIRTCIVSGSDNPTHACLDKGRKKVPLLGIIA